MPKPAKSTRPPKEKLHPVRSAVEAWLNSEGSSQDKRYTTQREQLLSTVPKKYTIYEPMALLPAGSFSSLPWTTLLEDRGTLNWRADLWALILRELSKQAKGQLTHLAINEGIPPRKNGEDDENVLRSPSGLRMLYGDFGLEGKSEAEPFEEEFNKILWVSTKQNGIHQTWAPKWTMFSRGNVKEKARLLDFGKASSRMEDIWAVDLYAGIGYFVFSYATLGLRVLGWEINPWSVEGLRRGAIANGWSVRIVQGEELQRPTADIVAGGETIIVFLESNEEALRRIQELQGSDLARNIQHVNGGFLPTSEPTWRPACEMTKYSPEAWLHLHENVGVGDYEDRQKSIQNMFNGWVEAGSDTRREPLAEHVELVKTFAPGVWHCVFDVYITTTTTTNSSIT